MKGTVDSGEGGGGGMSKEKEDYMRTERKTSTECANKIVIKFRKAAWIADEIQFTFFTEEKKVDKNFQ